MSFEGMYKHVGQLSNTGKNVVVVFMQLPDDENHALVIDTDALPDSYNESLRRVLESDEGQNSRQLADILARRMSPDGSNLSLLQKFHEAGRLQKVPVDLVNMTPRRGVIWPLRDVVAAMAQAKAESPSEFDDLTPEEKAIIAAETKKFNMHASNIDNSNNQTGKDQAASLLEMAKMLEADAANKREQAYRMDPSLIPANKGKLTSMINPVETAKPESTAPLADTTEVATKTTKKTTKAKTA